MQRAVRLFASLLFLLLVVTGCKALREIPAPPSSYDEQCQPSDDFYLKWAQETEDLAAAGEVPSDPQEAYDKALAEIQARGLRLVDKRETGIQAWDGFSTTSPDTIFLAPDWDDRNVKSRAATLWHEMVHVRQFERRGREKLTLVYLVPEGRWSHEVPAYTESWRTWRLFGATDDELRDALHRQAESLYVKYQLDATMPPCIKEVTIQLWETNLGL